MEETLRPCPFCGAEAEIVRNGSGSYFVRCTNKQCAAKTRLYHENENGARLAWNRRAERTCRMRFDDRELRYRCSRCGCLSETYRSTDGRWYAPEYCTACGARVVSER